MAKPIYREASPLAEKVEPVSIDVVITAGHVYLPLDTAGNVPANWRDCTDTQRVEHGTRLKMPQDMLDCLHGRAERAR